ncbi:MAG: DUF4394 domain-containing protein [Luteolibacter sp.]
MKNKHFITTIITTIITYGILTASSHAVSIFGIGTNNSLYQFDSATPGTVNQIGAAGSASNLVDIDFHGANGLLYGVSSAGLTYTVNIQTGAQTQVTTPLDTLSGITAIDFNPLADRIRLVGSGNFNARLTPDVQTAPTATQANGTVTMDASFSLFQSDGTTARSGATVLGAGYTNPIDNPSATTLYTLASDGFLSMHTAPTGSFAIGNAVGVAGLGFIPVGSGFDIGVNGSGYAFDGTNLRLIDITTGTSTSLGAVGVGIRSLAVVPEPSTYLLGAVACLGLLRRRRTP